MTPAARARDAGDAREQNSPWGEGFVQANPQGPVSLYLHIPFCAQKCPYCDFNTYAGLGALYDDTVHALCAELAEWGPRLAGRPVKTVFLGGGTPTVLSAAQLTRLFAAVHGHFALAEGCEVTSEANPGTVDQQSFDTLRALGVNRLSLGVQSFQPAELAFLGRIHGAEDVTRAFSAARSAGFDDINLDFIFGLPDQQPALWEDTLARALALGPEHLSLYSLIVEENTPLYNWVETGRVAAPDDDLAATLFESAIARLAAGGYAHYEVSNWARLTPSEAPAVLQPARASRHNRVYWRNGEYVGIGPGAHSHLRLRDSDGRNWSRRWSNRKPVAGYVRRMQQGAPVEAFSELLDERTAMGETMMVGLRLVREGVPYAHFARLHGADLRTVFAAELADLAALGLLMLDAERVRLTERGLLLGNQVFARFLAEPATEPAGLPT